MQTRQSQRVFGARKYADNAIGSLPYLAKIKFARKIIIYRVSMTSRRKSQSRGDRLGKVAGPREAMLCLCRVLAQKCSRRAMKMTQFPLNPHMWLILGASLFARDVQGQDNVLRAADARDSDPLVQRIRESGGEPGFVGDKIVRLGIYEPQGNDHSFPFLKELADLEELDINYTNSAEWVQHIAGLPKLSRVSIYKCSLTDASCEELAKLKQLRVLVLEANDIADAGIATIAGVANLEVSWFTGQFPQDLRHSNSRNRSRNVNEQRLQRRGSANRA
jgi:hypothetical protein